jgi:hypothetical protein
MSARASNSSSGDQRRRGALASEQRTQRVAPRDAVRVRIGLEQDAELLASLEQRDQVDDAPQVREVGELRVDVVTDQGAQSRRAQTGVRGQVLGLHGVGEHEYGRIGFDPGQRRNRRSCKGRLLAHQSELVPRLGIEALDRCGGEPPRQRLEAGGPRARLIVARDPAQDLLLAGTDPAPQAGRSEPVADDDPACHPASGMSPTGVLAPPLRPIRVPGGRRARNGGEV